MDPRHNNNKETATPPVMQPQPVKKKAIPLPTAELPPTRLKAASCEQTPAAVPKAVIETPPPKAPKKSAKNAAKEQKRLELLQFAEANGIHPDHAYLVIRGDWTMERAKQQARRQKIQQLRVLSEARPASILQGWLEKRVELIRLTSEGPRVGRLLEIQKYEWRWDDQPLREEKLDTFALLTGNDARIWGAEWSKEAELEALGLKVPESCPDRRYIPDSRLHWAMKNQAVCRVTLY